MLGSVACTWQAGLPVVDASTPLALEMTPSITPIVWFPPTETATIAPAATVPATPERRPGVGALMVEDPMTSATHWNAAASGNEPATVSSRGLSLSAQPGGLPVIALHRSAVFDDMYLEITARPNLCRGTDSYGVVFRAPNDVASYRFVAVCNGTAAAERVSLGTPRVLQPPTSSSDVPVGAPGEVRLGVWAQGSEFRFFLNDRYQFSVTDRNYLSGGIGVFATASGDSPVVVTFSDLRVYQLETPAASATPSP
jgi:hypothetical protein